MSSFALVLKPGEANTLFLNWPQDAWLVIIKSAEEQRWEACTFDFLSNVIGDKPVWPPLMGLAVAEINTETEIGLIRHLSSIPGIAQAAEIKLTEQAPVEEKTIEINQIDWD